MNTYVLSRFLFSFDWQDVPMKLLETTIVIWDQMAGVMMLMRGLSYVEDQLNLLQLKNSWSVKTVPFGS